MKKKKKSKFELKMIIKDLEAKNKNILFNRVVFGWFYLALTFLFCIEYIVAFFNPDKFYVSLIFFWTIPLTVLLLAVTKKEN